ncbi:MAG: hypothetical protein EXS30_01500 [Pedosphaera sp.]|nr:hypothetical protein [Pedosphaera sp.]
MQGSLKQVRRRQDGFHRDLIQTLTKAVEHNIDHAETSTDEEPLHKLSGPNASQRCSGFAVEGVESGTKKLETQATTMKVAPDHCQCEIRYTISVHGPTSAGSYLAELSQDKIQAWNVVEECSVGARVRRDYKLKCIAFEYLKTRVTIRL